MHNTDGGDGLGRRPFKRQRIAGSRSPSVSSSGSFSLVPPSSHADAQATAPLSGRPQVDFGSSRHAVPSTPIRTSPSAPEDSEMDIYTCQNIQMCLSDLRALSPSLLLSLLQTQICKQELMSSERRNQMLKDDRSLFDALAHASKTGEFAAVRKHPLFREVKSMFLAAPLPKITTPEKLPRNDIESKLNEVLDFFQKNNGFDMKRTLMDAENSLLLRGLDKTLSRQMVERVNRIFCNNSIILNPSGSGKTRALLEGLTLNWGLYITGSSGSQYSCNQDARIGSDDVQTALQHMERMTELIKPSGSPEQRERDVRINITNAQRCFDWLVLSRLLVLLRYLQATKKQPVEERRRGWVLFQAKPPHTAQGDIFQQLLVIIRLSIPTNVLDMIRDTNTEICNDPDLADLQPLRLVIDEVQDMSRSYDQYFVSDASPHAARPVLRPLLEALFFSVTSRNIFKSYTLSGTGLSRENIQSALSSVAAKYRCPLRFITDVGSFSTRQEICDYITTVMDLYTFPTVQSQRQFEDLAVMWLHGRYRFLASCLEVLIWSKTKYPLSALKTYVFHLTGVMPSIISETPPPSADDTGRIRSVLDNFKPLFESDFVARVKDLDIFKTLILATLRWFIGSQPVPVPNRDSVLVAGGVGRLRTSANEREDVLDTSPVFIDESLSTLYLLKSIGWNTVKESFMDDLAKADSSTCGFKAEQILLLALLEKFSAANQSPLLGDVFAFSKPDERAEHSVALVALRQDRDSWTRHYPSWECPSSSRFGFEAETFGKTCEFFINPNGIPFLFPDRFMHPDLVFLLEDLKTNELIWVVLQSKWRRDGISLEDKKQAIASTGPSNFYLDKRMLKEAQLRNGQVINLMSKITPNFIQIVAVIPSDLSIEDMPKLDTKYPFAMLKQEIVETFMGSQRYQAFKRRHGATLNT